MKPYKEEVKEHYFIREFSDDVTQDELVWHRDLKDRKIEVLEGRGWKFQIDNSLPFNIIPGDHLTVKAKEYHRLIKGDTSLKLRITEKL
jgi:hypothetical protein